MSLQPEVLDKTLQELDGEDWGEAPYQSHLVSECHHLRHVPLKDFTPENLRIMIRQQFCLEYLLPLALEQLEADPWVSGDYYEGDLLSSVLSIRSAFWIEHEALRRRLDTIVECALEYIHRNPSPKFGVYEKSTLEVLSDYQQWKTNNRG